MFSVRHTVALALTGASLTPDSFTDAAVNAPDLVRLRERVRVTPTAGIPVGASPVTVTLTSGQVLEYTATALQVVPDDELPGQRTLLEQKFRDLVVPILGSDRAEKLLNTVRRIEKLDVISELTDLTATKD
jgi:2-methylcitrate dehydratase PrpD